MDTKVDAARAFREERFRQGATLPLPRAESPRAIDTAEKRANAWWLREYFTAPSTSDGPWTWIGGHVVAGEGVRDDRLLAELLVVLRWPLAPGGQDPILAGWPVPIAAEAPGSAWHCPIDGAIPAPMLVQVISPASHWQMRFGRHVVASVCPHCLFEFHAIVAARS